MVSRLNYITQPSISRPSPYGEGASSWRAPFANGAEARALRRPTGRLYSGTAPRRETVLCRFCQMILSPAQ